MSKDNTTKKKLKLTAKESAAVDYYCDLNSETRNNWCASYKKAGYSQCKGWEKNAERVRGKDRICAAIAKKVAKRQARIEHNYDIAIKELNTYINYLESQAAKGNVSAVTAITSLLREKNDIAGLHKQRFIDESEQRRQLTESEEREAKRLASIRLAEVG